MFSAYFLPRCRSKHLKHHIHKDHSVQPQNVFSPLPQLRSMTWHSVKSNFRSNLSLVDQVSITHAALNNLGLIFLWQWFNDLQNYFAVGWACVDVDTSTLYRPVTCQSTAVIYQDSRHDTRATPHQPFISLLNNTCQTGSRSQEQGERWGFENCITWITAIQEFLWSRAAKRLAKAQPAVKRNLHMQLPWLDQWAASSWIY